MQSVWVEKYRPRHLRDMVGQAAVVPLLEAYAAKKTMPHLMFAGPPGTGKTTAALALAHDLYGEEWKQNFLELNASDERGIDTVRTTIKGYARTSPIGGTGFKILFLDEADNLTSEAQASLRRLMERYSAGCRFILSCNYSSRIIEPIQSRCAVFRFRVLPTSEIRKQLERVAHGESKRVEDDAYQEIVTQSEGDLRRAINLLQLTATYADPVTLGTIRELVTTPLESEVRALVDAAIRDRFFDARAQLHRLLSERGSSGEDIVRALHRYVLIDGKEQPLSPSERIELIADLAEVDFRIAEGASDRIQIESLLARLALRHARAS